MVFGIYRTRCALVLGIYGNSQISGHQGAPLLYAQHLQADWRGVVEACKFGILKMTAATVRY